MAKSREELRRELQASLGLGDTPKASKPVKAAKPTAPAANPFSRARVTTAATLGVQSNGVAVAEHDEDEDEDEEVVEEVVGDDEPEATPVEEFVSILSQLLDFVADHKEALKSFLNSAS